MTPRQMRAQALARQMPAPPSQLAQASQVIRAARGRGQLPAAHAWRSNRPVHCPCMHSASAAALSAAPATPPPAPVVNTDSNASATGHSSVATQHADGASAVDHSQALLRAFAALEPVDKAADAASDVSDAHLCQSADDLMDMRDETAIDKENEHRLAGDLIGLYRGACIRKARLRSAGDASARKCARLEVKNASKESDILELKKQLEEAKREALKASADREADQRKLLDLTTRLQTCDTSRRLAWAKFFHVRRADSAQGA